MEHGFEQRVFLRRSRGCLAHYDCWSKRRRRQLDAVELRSRLCERVCARQATAIKLRARHRHEGTKVETVVACQDASNGNAATSGNRDRARFKRLGEFILHPRWATIRRSRDRKRIV